MTNCTFYYYSNNFILFIFLISIILYLYLLILDSIDKKNVHSTEEIIWIYVFLFVLVICFIISYYCNECSKIEIKPSNSFGFTGTPVGIKKSSKKMFGKLPLVSKNLI